MPLSWIPYEEETLIPPYTSITMLKEETEYSVKHYEVEVAFDNKESYGEINCPINEIYSKVRTGNYIEENKENSNNDEREVPVPIIDDLSHISDERKDHESSDEDSLNINHSESNRSMISDGNEITQSQPHTGQNTLIGWGNESNNREYHHAVGSEEFWLNFKLI